jgi:hypothetical protein
MFSSAKGCIEKFFVGDQQKVLSGKSVMFDPSDPYIYVPGSRNFKSGNFHDLAEKLNPLIKETARFVPNTCETKWGSCFTDG